MKNATLYTNSLFQLMAVDSETYICIASPGAVYCIFLLVKSFLISSSRSGALSLFFSSSSALLVANVACASWSVAGSVPLFILLMLCLIDFCT